MDLIDSHAHLTFAGLVERLDDVLDNARAAGVRHIITVASDAGDAEMALDIAHAQTMVSCTAGIHPHEAVKVGEDDLDRVAALLDEPEVKAVGEIGLDYHYDFADRRTQMDLLSAQLEIARPTDLPLVIHCREAFDDTISLLRQHGYADRPVVFHCFTGSAEDAKRVAKHGWRISFTGIVTFKNSAALAVIAAEYPLDKLMLETDSPYLSPIPVRNVQPNEPAHLVHTARFLAERRGLDVEDLASRTADNTRRFFNLPG